MGVMLVRIKEKLILCLCVCGGRGEYVILLLNAARLKAWTAIDKLSVIYGSQTWPVKWNAVSSKQRSCRYCYMDALLGRMEKKLDGNYTGMLRAILNKSWRQHPTKHQLYSHLPPIMKTIKIRRTRHAGHCWRSRDELISDVLL